MFKDKLGDIELPPSQLMNIKIDENPKLFTIYIQILEIKIKLYKFLYDIQCRKDDMQLTKHFW